MQLRGIRFHPVLGASGVQNFFGDGYWFHRLLRFVPGFSLRGMSFVAKTVTFYPTAGNMPLGLDGVTPRDRFPACVWSCWQKGITLNAVGLSNIGAEALMNRHRWQSMAQPFWLSFMSVLRSKEERLQEMRLFVRLLLAFRHQFRAPFGLQINGSCPNQKNISAEQAAAEAHEMLDIADQLKVPLMYKLSVTTRPDQIRQIAEHEALDALCVSNTIPFGALPDRIDWHALFELPRDLPLSPELSPIWAATGMAGGLSGPPLFPLVCEWIKQARSLGITKHINGGGGIFSRADVRALKAAGADSVSMGTVVMHRPWRMRGMIKEAHKQFGEVS